MDRPFVYMNMAATVDGKITSAAREYPGFTSGHDRETMDQLRAEADAVLVGAGTLRADNLPIRVRSEEMREYRASLGKPPGLINVVVSRSLDLDSDSEFFRDPDTRRIIATVDGAPAERARRLESGAQVWRLGRQAVDLARLLSRLREEGVQRLLIEGGGELNWQVVEAGLLDELYLTLAPSLLGGREAPTLLEGRGFSMEGRCRLALLEVERHGDELYCRYAVQR